MPIPVAACLNESIAFEQPASFSGNLLGLAAKACQAQSMTNARMTNKVAATAPNANPSIRLAEPSAVVVKGSSGKVSCGWVSATASCVGVGVATISGVLVGSGVGKPSG